MAWVQGYSCTNQYILCMLHDRWYFVEACSEGATICYTWRAFMISECKLSLGSRHKSCEPTTLQLLQKIWLPNWTVQYKYMNPELHILSFSRCSVPQESCPFPVSHCMGKAQFLVISIHWVKHSLVFKPGGFLLIPRLTKLRRIEASIICINPLLHNVYKSCIKC